MKLLSRKMKLSKNTDAAPAVTSNSNALDVANAFLSAQRYDTEAGMCLRWHRSQWLRCTGKIFVSMPIEDLTSEIMRFIQGTTACAKAKRSFVGDVILNLQGRCGMASSVALPAKWNGTEWVPQPDCIVVENGIVDLKGLLGRKRKHVLTPHTPSFVSQVCLPFKFKPTARCSKWLRFLRQILPDPDRQQLLQEIFGYCLTFDTSQQKCFMFEGTGANGKGVVTNILTRLLGEANVSNVPLESFGKEHDPVVMLGKLVNIASEVGELPNVAESQLKQFTGEDLMHFNPKYKAPFSARPTARILISTNVRPKFRDRSEGLWRRLILIPFTVTIPEEKRNTRLVEDLTPELSGIFNWALEGTRSLRKRNRFTEPTICREARTDFQRESNPARMFLEDTYVFVPRSEDGVTKTTLYKYFKDYCADGGYMSQNAANFAKEVLHVFPSVKKERSRQADGSRPNVYQGVIRKDTIENQRPDRAA